MLQWCYVCLIWKLYFFTLSKCDKSSDDVITSFITNPNQTSYPLGSSVTLSCTVKDRNDFKYLFLRKDKSMKSEACTVYDNNMYDISCMNITENNSKLVKLTIKKLTWDDRGQWDCFFMQTNKAVFLNISVNPIFEPLQIHALAPIESVIQKVDSSKTTIYRLSGKGTRTNPYNLRDGSSVNITCLSSCSFPGITHKWIYENSSQYRTEVKEVRVKTRDLCNLATNKGMTAIESEVTINCSRQKIVGANMVVCLSSVGEEVKNSTVYILCPGGERPWELTSGEIVGISASVAIFLLLVMFICVLVKRSRYTSVPGDMSTNTYSSGVKV